MVIEIPRPPYGTPRAAIAEQFGVSRHTLYAAERTGRLERTARVFRLRVRSAGAFNVTPPHVRVRRATCLRCGVALTYHQQQNCNTCCSRRCAMALRWQECKETRNA